MAFPPTSAPEWWGHGCACPPVYLLLEPVCLNEPLQSPIRPYLSQLPLSLRDPGGLVPGTPCGYQIHGSSRPSYEMMPHPQPAQILRPQQGWRPGCIPQGGCTLCCLPTSSVDSNLLFIFVI